MKNYSQSINRSSSSSHSTRNLISRVAEHPKCKHGELAFVNICKKQPNFGREFYTCPFWEDSKQRCGFFQWVDDGAVKPRFEDEFNNICEQHRVEKEALENEMQKLSKIMGKLKKKKAILEEEIKKNKEETLKLKMELVTASNGKKLAYRALIVTWVFAAIMISMWFVKM